MKLPMSTNCGKKARELIADGNDPNEILEFYRGDVLCLRGKAGTFADTSVQENDRVGPRFIKYRPFVRGSAKEADSALTATHPLG